MSETRAACCMLWVTMNGDFFEKDDEFLDLDV
jgi:hypothetical protein